MISGLEANEIRKRQRCSLTTMNRLAFMLAMKTFLVIYCQGLAFNRAAAPSSQLYPYTGVEYVDATAPALNPLERLLNARGLIHQSDTYRMARIKDRDRALDRYISSASTAQKHHAPRQHGGQPKTDKFEQLSWGGFIAQNAPSFDVSTMTGMCCRRPGLNTRNVEVSENFAALESLN